MLTYSLQGSSCGCTMPEFFLGNCKKIKVSLSFSLFLAVLEKCQKTMKFVILCAILCMILGLVQILLLKKAKSIFVQLPTFTDVRVHSQVALALRSYGLVLFWLSSKGQCVFDYWGEFVWFFLGLSQKS